jgi:hypothetical protein
LPKIKVCMSSLKGPNYQIRSYFQRFVFAEIFSSKICQELFRRQQQ